VSGSNGTIWVNYPLLSWMEVVVFGIIFGKMLRNNSQRAYKRGLLIGVVFLLLFLILRILDGFGNTRPMDGNSWIDFLNVVKYPPSITFNLLTLGINLIILWGFSIVKVDYQKYLNPLIVIGRVALFVYVLHLFLYAIMGLILTPDGTSIPTMYLYWLLGLVILYPLSLKYGAIKHSRPSNSVFRYF
jgi:uncharacterized membrane protein